MSVELPLGRWLAVGGLCALLLSACTGNQYGPPVYGQPRTWGQQHYLDNERYQRTIDEQQSD